MDNYNNCVLLCTLKTTVDKIRHAADCFDHAEFPLCIKIITDVFKRMHTNYVHDINIAISDILIAFRLFASLNSECIKNNNDVNKIIRFDYIKTVSFKFLPIHK